MKNTNLIPAFLLLTVSVLFSSCAAIESIFNAGVGVGVFVVLFIIVIIVVIVMKGKKGA